MALVNGGVLYLLPPGASAARPTSSRASLREQAITTATLTPSALSALPVEGLSTVRTMRRRGEMLRGAGGALEPGSPLLQRLRTDGDYRLRDAPRVQLPVFRCAPIGSPIANAQVYVLDRDRTHSRGECRESFTLAELVSLAVIIGDLPYG